MQGKLEVFVGEINATADLVRGNAFAELLQPLLYPRKTTDGASPRSSRIPPQSTR